jgi:hypothetical protein
MIKRFTPILLSTFAFLLGWDLLTRQRELHSMRWRNHARLTERLIVRLSPYLVASQAYVPIVAIAPLLVIWLGDGILSKVVICALIVFFPCW